MRSPPAFPEAAAAWLRLKRACRIWLLTRRQHHAFGRWITLRVEADCARVREVLAKHEYNKACRILMEAVAQKDDGHEG